MTMSTWYGNTSCGYTKNAKGNWEPMCRHFVQMPDLDEEQASRQVQLQAQEEALITYERRKKAEVAKLTKAELTERRKAAQRAARVRWAERKKMREQEALEYHSCRPAPPPEPPAPPPRGFDPAEEALRKALAIYRTLWPGLLSGP